MTMDDSDNEEVLPDLPFKFSPLRETKTPSSAASAFEKKKVSKRKLNLPPDSHKEILAEYSTVKKKDFSLDNLLKEKKKSTKKLKGIDSYFKEIISDKNGDKREVSPTASLVIHNDDNDDDDTIGKKVEMDGSKEGYYIYDSSSSSVVTVIDDSSSAAAAAVNLKFNLLSLNVYSNNDLLSFLFNSSSSSSLSCLESDLILGELKKRRFSLKKDNCNVLKDYGLLYSSSSSSSSIGDLKKIKKTSFSTSSTLTDSAMGLMNQLKLSLNNSSSIQNDDIQLWFYSLLLLLLDSRITGHYLELHDLISNLLNQDVSVKEDMNELIYNLFDEDGLHGLVDFIRVIPDYSINGSSSSINSSSINSSKGGGGLREQLALHFLLKSLDSDSSVTGDTASLLKQKLCFDFDLKSVDYDLFKCQLELLWYSYPLLLQLLILQKQHHQHQQAKSDLVECLYNLSKKINDRKAVSLERTEVKDLLMRIHQKWG